MRGNEQAFPRYEKHFDGLTVREYFMARILPAVIIASAGKATLGDSYCLDRASQLVERALAATQAADTYRGPKP